MAVVGRRGGECGKQSGYSALAHIAIAVLLSCGFKLASL